MEYLSEILHVDIVRKKYRNTSLFPLYLRGEFDYDILSYAGDSVYLAIKPKEPMALPKLRKAYLEIRELTRETCILELTELSKYAEERLSKEGIPFYVKGGAVYLPFGLYFPGANVRKVKPIDSISFSTQKLLLVALYNKWEGKKASDIAKALSVSEMTVSRAFDEIEGAKLPLITKMRRKRYFDNDLSQKDYYSLIEPILRNPVKKVIRLAKKPRDTNLKSSGVSALSCYSMIADNHYPTYGVSQKQLRSMNLRKEDYASMDDEPAAVIHVLGYVIDDYDKKAIDPVSAILSLSETDRNDNRIAKEIEMVKERVLHVTRN